MNMILFNKNQNWLIILLLFLIFDARSQIFTQAETMALTNYSKENSVFASDGKCIKVDKDATGTAQWAFSGPDGSYDIKVWYFDEKDGNSEFSVFVNGARVDFWKSSRQGSCSTVPAVCNLVSRTLLGVTIKKGWTISFQGTYSPPGEFARFDCIYFNAAPTISTPIAMPATINAGATTTLSVSAADDGGEQNLKYAWKKISGPGPVTFGKNGSNVSKTISATIPIAGTYVFVVKVSDRGFNYERPLRGIEPPKKTISSCVTVNVTTVNTPPKIAKPAFATSNPVVTTSTVISVLGTDDAGESNLTYTWDVLGTPVTPVQFGINATNAAKTTTISFAKAGTYPLHVVITDKGGLSIADTLILQVQQRARGIAIKPDYQRILINAQQQFVAIADSDQFGNSLLQQPNFVWSASSGGTIDTNGLFTAFNTIGGPFTINASAQTMIGTAKIAVCNDSFDAFATIPAASFSTMSGIVTEPCSEGGLDVSGIQDQDALVFYNVNFGIGGATVFCARIATGSNGGSIELRLDSANSPLLASCAVPQTGGWQTWADVLCNFPKVIGKHSLYIKFIGNKSIDLFNINTIHFTSISSIAAGDVSTFFLTSDNALWALGSNEYGQLGDGTTQNRTNPVHIMSGVKAMSSGISHSLFLKIDGTLWACGENLYGQLGDGTTTDRYTPVQVMSNVQSMRAGGEFSLMLKTDGTLWGCGDNEIGELGDNTTVSHLLPELIMSNVKTLAKGQSWHNLVVKTDGTLWTFGYNATGQVGDGTINDRYIPIQIMTDVKGIAGGWDHSLIVQTNGSLWASGLNSNGELGDNTDVTKLTPTQVLAGVKEVSAGCDYSFILKADSTVWGFGINDGGELGTGDTNIYYTPVKVDSGVQSIAVGQAHTLMLKEDGSLWGCGIGAFGDLGTGPITVNWLKPQPILLGR